MVIARLENTSNTFKTVNISKKINIKDIVSVASSQAKKKGGKSALSHHPKFSQPDDSSPPSKITEIVLEDKKSQICNQKATKRRSSIFQKSPLDISSFIADVEPKIANKVRIYLTNEDPAQWKVRRRRVKTILNILQA